MFCSPVSGKRICFVRKERGGLCSPSQKPVLFRTACERNFFFFFFFSGVEENPLRETFNAGEGERSDSTKGIFRVCKQSKTTRSEHVSATLNTR